MKGYIKLESGEIFEGQLAESTEDIYGEIVFCTDMTGYQDVLTDPSYYGQIVVFTYPLIGNYGWNLNDIDKNSIQPAGIVISETQDQVFHYEAEESLPDVFRKAGIPFLSDVDTRALVKTVREKGEMGAVLSTSHEKASFQTYQPMEERKVIRDVSTKEPLSFGKDGFHVVMIDFGYKPSTVSHLLQYGCRVTVVPYNYGSEKISELKPDGIFFSDGPGNPAQVKAQLPEYRELAETYPTLGLCMGHQILALAFGAKTEKLHFGHRGANQPVLNVKTNKVFMTAQNHSYKVDENSLPKGEFIVQYKNVNDGSVEGLSHLKHDIITTQFHPDASSADSKEIYDQFYLHLKKKGRERTYA